LSPTAATTSTNKVTVAWKISSVIIANGYDTGLKSDNTGAVDRTAA
jgi:hypothetical protein